MRELAAAALLLLALAVGALAPKIWPDAATGEALASGRPAVSGPLATVASATFAPVSWTGKDGGTGYVICGSTGNWSRPTLAEQNAHLASDPRFARMRADDSSSPAWRPFHASALPYDGSSLSARVDIVALSGMWTDPSIGGNALGCMSIEPQIWLVGYEPIAYASNGSLSGALSVRPAPGYRMVILTAAPQAVSVLEGGKTIVAIDLVKQLPPRMSTPTPMPTPANKAPAPRSPLVPMFPHTDRPLELAMPSTCAIESAGRHDDDLGMTWRVQCGSAKANVAVATAAIAQGWKLGDGNPPIGVGMQNYSKNDVWMQIAYRLDGPAFADPFVIVQTLRPGAGGNDLAPHDFAIGPMCGIVDPPTMGQTPGIVARKWLARCGDLAKAIVWIEAWNAKSGWTSMSVVHDQNETRRYCKATLETLWHSGPELGSGIVAITQTEGGCR